MVIKMVLQNIDYSVKGKELALTTDVRRNNKSCNKSVYYKLGIIIYNNVRCEEQQKRVNNGARL